ncbi:MAG: HmuY family protein, partial [Candidatus Eisenbacteria bacterium]
DAAPQAGDGYAPSQVVEAIEGHTYVLLTRDGHYAKIRIIDLDAEDLTFQWAYQQQPGNVELKRPMVP